MEDLKELLQSIDSLTIQAMDDSHYYTAKILKKCKETIQAYKKTIKYKNNLPSYLDIMEKVNYYIFSRNTKEYKDKIKLAKAIRKLIEGKK